MDEATDTKPEENLDSFVEAMLDIAGEARGNPAVAAPGADGSKAQPAG